MSAIDVVFTLDQTGSMRPVTHEAKRRIKDASAKLFADIPDLRIGFIGHGDYCDYRTYVTKELEPTALPQSLEAFLDKLEGVGGGDAPEAYEEALYQATRLSWREGAKKVLVVVGDEVPHETSYRAQNGQKVRDWREETNKLADMGVVIHGVQCLGNRHASSFYSKMAGATGGQHLHLQQFANIVELIEAVAYQQAGQLDEYSNSLVTAGKMNRGLAEIIARLGGVPAKIALTPYAGAADLDAVPPFRFQVLHVDERSPIKEFVTRSGARFKIGRGFYQFTKTETVQGYKEVVLRDKATGDMFSGNRARELAGLPLHSSARMRPETLEQYDVFVQSTSANRVLMPHTLFLYEIEEWS